MARHLLITLVVALLLLTALSGCLRVEFDRCDDDEPHPDCALLDGATDGGDASTSDASAPDAALDAGT